MPKRFMWRGADVYLPVTFARGTVVEGIRNVHLLGRLKPGVTDAQAEADLNPIIADLAKKEPTQFPQTWRVGLLSFKETFPEQHPRRSVDPLRRRRPAAPDRVRQRVEPPAVEGGRPSARNGRACRARRQPAAPAASAADREPDPRGGRRHRRDRPRVRRAARDPDARAAEHDPRRVRDRAQPAGAPVRAGDLGRDQRDLRPGARAPHVHAGPGEPAAQRRPQRVGRRRPRRSFARASWSARSRSRSC